MTTPPPRSTTRQAPQLYPGTFAVGQPVVGTPVVHSPVPFGPWAWFDGPAGDLTITGFGIGRTTATSSEATATDGGAL